MAIPVISIKQTIQKSFTISTRKIRFISLVTRYNFLNNLTLFINYNRAFFSVSRHRLSLVQRKTLVLDLDETLIHSHHDGLPRNPSIKPGTPHDFSVSSFHNINTYIYCKRESKIRKKMMMKEIIRKIIIIIQTQI